MVRMNGMNGMNGMGPRGPMYGHRGQGGNGGSGGLLGAAANIAGTAISHGGIVIGFIIGLAAVRRIWQRRNG